MASFETGGSDMLKLEWMKYSPEEPKEGLYFVAVDLAGFTQDDGGPKSLYSNLDRTSIAIVKVDQTTGKWWVKRIEAGRWGVEETAQRIVSVLLEVRPAAFGIEKGALYRAVAPYLEKLAARKNVPIRAVPLTHDNVNKTNRVVWALQGRFEHGNIVLNPGDWVRDFEDEYLHFPSKLVKDDMIDSLAYIDQLVKDYVFGDFAEQPAESYWKPLDARAGF
jgi:predicted phage terminase large subunit-like protein